MALSTSRSMGPPAVWFRAARAGSASPRVEDRPSVGRPVRVPDAVGGRSTSAGIQSGVRSNAPRIERGEFGTQPQEIAKLGTHALEDGVALVAREAGTAAPRLAALVAGVRRRDRHRVDRIPPEGPGTGPAGA